jgi:hypothetical protein
VHWYARVWHWNFSWEFRFYWRIWRMTGGSFSLLTKGLTDFLNYFPANNCDCKKGSRNWILSKNANLTQLTCSKALSLPINN